MPEYSPFLVYDQRDFVEEYVVEVGAYAEELEYVQAIQDFERDYGGRTSARQVPREAEGKKSEKGRGSSSSSYQRRHTERLASRSSSGSSAATSASGSCSVNTGVGGVTSKEKLLSRGGRMTTISARSTAAPSDRTIAPGGRETAFSTGASPDHENRSFSAKGRTTWQGAGRSLPSSPELEVDLISNPQDAEEVLSFPKNDLDRANVVEVVLAAAPSHVVGVYRRLPDEMIHLASGAPVMFVRDDGLRRAEEGQNFVFSVLFAFTGSVENGYAGWYMGRCAGRVLAGSSGGLQERVVMLEPNDSFDERTRGIFIQPDAKQFFYRKTCGKVAGKHKWVCWSRKKPEGGWAEERADHAVQITVVS